MFIHTGFYIFSSVRVFVQFVQRAEQEALEAKARERELNMTPEEKLAEKLRLQKVQEESDLRAAMDTFGISGSVDGINPTTRAELSELGDAISRKVNLYSKVDDYPGFLEELIRSVCANCKSIHPNSRISSP